MTTDAQPDPYAQTVGELVHGLKDEVARCTEAERLIKELVTALELIVAMYGPSGDYDGPARQAWERAETALVKAEWARV